MISSSRRLNYTRRRKINRKHARITTHVGLDGELPTFDGTLDLAHYDLPGPARVFVEAYRQTAYQRFDFGTVGGCKVPEDRALREFGEADGVLFRVKVVEPALEGGAPKGPVRILAQADQIKPDQAGKRRSLLPVEPGDFRDEVWRLEFDETSGPLLRVSRHLAPDKYGLVRSDEFVTLVLPEILRRALTEAVKDGFTDQDEDGDSWCARWVRMAAAVAGRSVPNDEAQTDEDREQWVDNVVERFCRRHRIGLRFTKWGKAGDTV